MDHLLGHLLSAHHRLCTTGERNFCLGWRDKKCGYKSPSILSVLCVLEGKRCIAVKTSNAIKEQKTSF